MARLRHNLVFWILCAYAALLCAHLAVQAWSGAEAARGARAFQLQHVARLAAPLARDGRGKDLERYLRDAQGFGLVDWFELTVKGKTETSGTQPPSRPVFAEAVMENDGWIWTRADGADVSVRMACAVGWRSRLAAAWGAEARRLPADALFLAFVTLAGLFLQHRARRLAAGGAVSGARREQRRKRAARDASGARARAETGSFQGVCGRSALLADADFVPDEKFLASLEELYADAAAIVARYRGRLHGVHGHELLFSFSCADETLDARLALAAARDLAALAASRGFRLSSALAAGRLHGAQLVSGFALFGAPVEETSDLLQAMVSARDEGTWVTEALAKAAGAEFRAVPAGRRLHARALVANEPLEPALERARAGDPAGLAFHRSDAALAITMRSLTAEPAWTKEAYVAAVNELRRIPCRRCGPEVVAAYHDLLVAELARKDSYRLSSCVALAGAVLTRAVVDRSLERLFLQASAVKDRRVRANAVELFTKFFPERSIPELRPLVRDEDNRVSANALIKAACERFDEKVIGRLEERVRGGSVAHVASALHAMGEIALYYRRHDPLFLGSKLGFLRLFEGVTGWVRHPNPMIRRQAMLAAQKLRSEGVDARLREVFATCDDAELLALFADVYGWRKDARVAA